MERKESVSIDFGLLAYPYNYNLHYEKFPDGSVKCIEDEIPFELPEGWEWTRIRNISTVKGGKRLPKGMSFSETPTDHAYIRVTDMKNNTIITSDLRFIADDVYEKIKNYIISKDDLYVTIAGTIGVVGEVPDELDGMNLTENAVKITDITINKTFLCLLIQSEFVQQQFIDKTHQVAMPKLALERILSTLIPICSISEQSSIVSRFNALSVLVNDIQQNNQELIDTIFLTKSRILDLAIKGKLVPQNPDDEPASVLLDRIRAEKEELIKQGKIKRDKKESVIFKGEDNSYYETIGSKTINIDDEIPFDLPDGWEWCRLQTVCYPITDGTHKTPTYTDTGYTFLSAKNIATGKINWDNVMYIPKSLHDELYSRIAPQINDILLAKNGTTGVAAIVDRDCEFDIYVTLALLRVINEDISPLYLLKIIASPTIQDYFNSSLKGIGVPNLHLEHIRTTLILIPPIKEQKRIADKVSQLFSLLDSIAENVN